MWTDEKVGVFKGVVTFGHLHAWVRREVGKEWMMDGPRIVTGKQIHKDQ